MSWHWNLLCVDSATDEDPRGEGVRVPHLTCAEFIAAPYDPRDLGNQREHAPSDVCVVRKAFWTFDRFVDVRDDAVMPAPHLVPKEPNPTGRPTAHGASGDDAASFAVLLHGSLFNHEAALGRMDD